MQARQQTGVVARAVTAAAAVAILASTNRNTRSGSWTVGHCTWQQQQQWWWSGSRVVCGLEGTGAAIAAAACTAGLMGQIVLV